MRFYPLDDPEPVYEPSAVRIGGDGGTGVDPVRIIVTSQREDVDGEGDIAYWTWSTRDLMSASAFSRALIAEIEHCRWVMEANHATQEPWEWQVEAVDAIPRDVVPRRRQMIEHAVRALLAPDG